MEKLVEFVLGLIGIVILFVLGFASSLYGALTWDLIYGWFIQPVTGLDIPYYFWLGALALLGLAKVNLKSTRLKMNRSLRVWARLLGWLSRFVSFTLLLYFLVTLATCFLCDLRVDNRLK